MYPYSTPRANNQAFRISKVLRSQWDHCRSPKLLYKIQNRPKIQWTPPIRLSTKFGHQPDVVLMVYCILIVLDAVIQILLFKCCIRCFPADGVLALLCISSYVQDSVYKSCMLDALRCSVSDTIYQMPCSG